VQNTRNTAKNAQASVNICSPPPGQELAQEYQGESQLVFGRDGLLRRRLESIPGVHGVGRRPVGLIRSWPPLALPFRWSVSFETTIRPSQDLSWLGPVTALSGARLQPRGGPVGSLPRDRRAHIAGLLTAGKAAASDGGAETRLGKAGGSGKFFPNASPQRASPRG
jgi:hypothetical protein